MEGVFNRADYPYRIGDVVKLNDGERVKIIAAYDGDRGEGYWVERNYIDPRIGTADVQIYPDEIVDEDLEYQPGDYVRRYDGVIGRVNSVWPDGLTFIGYPDMEIEAELYQDDPLMPEKADDVK